jgi:DNA-binding CsgD family transcriptional regulator
LRLVCGRKAIAERLGISPRTVEIHRARVMKKVGAGNAVELVRRVLEPRGPAKA